MITSSGVICDICGKYILPLDLEEQVNTFQIKSIDGDLHCHNVCKQNLIECKENWHELPEGRIKEAYKNAYKEVIKCSSNYE